MTTLMTTWRRCAALSLIVLVTLAALAVVVAGQLWMRGQRADDDHGNQARGAAVRAVTLVLSYDYRRLPEGIEATEPLLSGDAKSQYDALQKPLLKTAPGLKAVVSSTVKESTLLDASDDSARVLLFVDQTSTSTKLDQPQLDESRIVVTLKRQGDHWLVDRLSAV